MQANAAPDVVTSTSMTVEVPIEGTDRSYTLRVPSWADAGAIAARAIGTLVPNDAIFVDRLRAAIGEAARPDAERAELLDGILAAEDASDELDSLFAVHGTDRKDWSPDTRKEIAAAQRRLAGAMRVRQRAEWVMRDDPNLAELRMHRVTTGRAEQAAVVALCLDTDPASVEAMPALDVTVLYQRAAGLMRPTQAAEKN